MTSSVQKDFRSSGQKVEQEARSVMGQVLDKGNDIASDVASRVSDGVSGIADSAYQTVESASEKVKDAAMSGKDYLTKNAVSDASDMIKNYPIASLLGAAALGFFIGRSDMFLSKTR